MLFRISAVFTVFMLCAMKAILAPAQTLTTLVNFDGTNGGIPSALVQGVDGNFYGTTSQGGANGIAAGYWCSPGCGTAFRVTPGGTHTVLYSFCSKSSQDSCFDGRLPLSGLTLGIDGSFYGTTAAGGTYCLYDGCGTIFKISPTGTLTTLHNFGGPDGKGPDVTLAQAGDGNFYGTTGLGGANRLCHPGNGINGGPAEGCGTLFKLTPGGKLTLLHSFCAKPNCTDGFEPYGVVEATDGNLYGATRGGPTRIYNWADATVFEVTTGGIFSTAYTFPNSDLDCSRFGPGFCKVLVQGSDGSFYGVAAGFFGGYGSVFKLTPWKGQATLYSFCSVANCTDGVFPDAGLIQGTDGNFYGTTSQGGASNSGTVFRITPRGLLTTLYSFCALASCTDGSNPTTALIQGTDGDLYGTTSSGGTGGSGTVFRLSLGLRPFVSFIRPSGIVGTTVQILGHGFTGTSGVSFSGTPASFSVKSDTYLTAIVPAGAITSYVTVTTPGATLKSNIMYRVKPQIFSISPTNGPVGTRVVITGESFTKTREVVFSCDDTPVSFTVDSDTQITAVIPTGASGGKFTVRTSGGSAMSPVGFGITP